MNSPDSFPKIVLALGGGGVRGFAHIGVLQALKENDIKIWGVVGTSMGALIGGAYAAGTDLYYLSRVAEHLQWETLIDLRLPQLGLINGKRVQTLIDLVTKGKRFEDLAIPFWAVATDLFSGEEIVFKAGPLAQAVRASISIPGVFNPVSLDGKVLVDGAVVAGVPVLVARQMEGNLVIAVNVGFDHTDHQVKNVFDVMSKVMDIMGNRLDSYQMDLADLVIKPQLGPIGTMHFNKIRECINIGRQAAQGVLPQLAQLISERARISKVGEK